MVGGPCHALARPVAAGLARTDALQKRRAGRVNAQTVRAPLAETV